MKSGRDAWEEFLNTYCRAQILSIAKEYPEKRSLEVSFGDIEKFSLELADELLSDPDTVLGHAHEALVSIDLPVEVSLEQAHVRVAHLPKRIPIRDLRSENITGYIAVEGLIRKATEVRPRIVKAAFMCKRCEHVTFVDQPEGKFIEPFMCESDTCGQRGPFKLLIDKSVFVDAQKIRIQESPEDLRGGEQPQTLDVDVVDDLAGMVHPGDRVIMSGVLRSYQRTIQHGKSTFFDLALDCQAIEISDKEFEDIEISPEDEDAIRTLGSDPAIFELIRKSIAPSIFGYDDLKEAMALQLFSGVPKDLPDGSRIRGDVHVLLVGDPGIAKSQLLRYAAKLAPRGIYTSGKSTTSAGLTATAVKDEFGDGRWTLEAGALVLADMGIACVDELDKMEADDRSALHEAMEQQTISVAKAGIMATLKSRCALLGAANPKFGRFDRFEGIAQQINMPPALISRFDLIFILTDQPNVGRDTSIAKHILAAHYAGELSARLDNLLNPGVTEEQVKNAMQVIQPEISPELLRKYVAYARRNIFPVITEEARNMLIDFYLSLRHQGEDPDAPVPVTARQLEALVRISEACARVRLSDSVTTEDAGRVISIVKSSLEQVMTDPETGKLDVDIVSVGMGKSQRDKVKVLRDIIRALQDESEYKLAQRSEIIERAKEKMNLTEEQIEDMIARLKTDGTLFEPRHGYIKLT